MIRQFSEQTQELYAFKREDDDDPLLLKALSIITTYEKDGIITKREKDDLKENVWADTPYDARVVLKMKEEDRRILHEEYRRRMRRIRLSGLSAIAADTFEAVKRSFPLRLETCLFEKVLFILEDEFGDYKKKGVGLNTTAFSSLLESIEEDRPYKEDCLDLLTVESRQLVEMEHRMWSRISGLENEAKSYYDQLKGPTYFEDDYPYADQLVENLYSIEEAYKEGRIDKATCLTQLENLAVPASASNAVDLLKDANEVSNILGRSYGIGDEIGDEDFDAYSACLEDELEGEDLELNAPAYLQPMPVQPNGAPVIAPVASAIPIFRGDAAQQVDEYDSSVPSELREHLKQPMFQSADAQTDRVVRAGAASSPGPTAERARHHHTPTRRSEDQQSSRVRSERTSGSKSKPSLFSLLSDMAVHCGKASLDSGKSGSSESRAAVESQGSLRSRSAGKHRRATTPVSPCQFFSQGSCKFGATCRNWHNIGTSGSDGTGAGSSAGTVAFNSNKSVGKGRPSSQPGSEISPSKHGPPWSGKAMGRIEEGSKVEANYRGCGKWYPGKVTRDRGNGIFDISYDDRDSEICVSEDMIRLLGGGGGNGSGKGKCRIEGGSKVKANSSTHVVAARAGGATAASATGSGAGVSPFQSKSADRGRASSYQSPFKPAVENKHAPASSENALRAARPYDDIYVFHDALNCPLPSRYIERHADGRPVQSKRADGTPDGGFVFAQNFPPSHGPPLGTVAVVETLRTALAFKVGEIEARQMKQAVLLENLHYKFVHPTLDPKNPFHTSAHTIKEMQHISGFQHIPPGDPKRGYDDLLLKSVIREAIGQVRRYSAADKARILFVLITSDGDFSADVQHIQEIGVDFVLIHNPDGQANAAFLSLADWHTGAWLKIVDQAQRERVTQALPHPKAPSPAPRARSPVPSRAPSPLPSRAPSPVPPRSPSPVPSRSSSPFESDHRVRLPNRNVLNYYKLIGKQHYFDPAVACIDPRLETRFEEVEDSEATGFGGKKKKHIFVFPVVAEAKHAGGSGVRLSEAVMEAASAAIGDVVDAIKEDSTFVRGVQPARVREAIAELASECRIMPIIPGLNQALDPVIFCEHTTSWKDLKKLRNQCRARVNVNFDVSYEPTQEPEDQLSCASGRRRTRLKLYCPPQHLAQALQKCFDYADDDDIRFYPMQKPPAPTQLELELFFVFHEADRHGYTRLVPLIPSMHNLTALDEIPSMSVRALKEAIAARGGDPASCMEKSDLRALLRKLLILDILPSMSVSALKAAIDVRGGDSSGCVEKSELRALLEELLVTR